MAAVVDAEVLSCSFEDGHCRPQVADRGLSTSEGSANRVRNGKVAWHLRLWQPRPAEVVRRSRLGVFARAPLRSRLAENL